MKDWKTGAFARAQSDFFAEFEDFYSDYPADVSAAEARLNERLRRSPDAVAMEKKAWVYEEIAASCAVKVFRYCPFYFEIVTGAPRNLLGSAFPPVSGLGSWVMRTDRTNLEADFDQWRLPYTRAGILYSTLYVDLAHHAMGVGNLLRSGFSGLRAQALERLETAREEGARTFYRSVVAAADSVRALGGKFSTEAARMLANETDPEARARLERIVRSAACCPYEAPATFYEALNTLWYAKELGNGMDSVGVAILGHVDRLLEPFYRRDLEAGRLTPEEARDLIYWFCAMTDAKWNLREATFGTNTSLNIGGCDENGRVVYNDITRFVIDAMRDLKLVNPKLQARFAPSAPPEYHGQIAALAAECGNVLSVFNDEVIIAAQTRMGKAEADARLYVNGGCQEILLSDTEVNSRGICYVNPVKYLEMMWEPKRYDFFDNEHIAPKRLEGAGDYEEFYGRVLQNLGLIINALVWRYNVFERRWPAHNPCPLYSMTLSDCLERGKDASQGGARYNNSSFALVGLGDFIDSLSAIRQTVFEERRFTLADIARMTQADFENNAFGRAYLRTRTERYGSDEAQSNRFAARVVRDVAGILSWMPNGRGGLYEASVWSFYGYEWMKAACGAAPDGKARGESLSRGMNPRESTRADMGALIHALSAMDLTRYAQPAVSYFTLPVGGSSSGAALCESLIRYFIACGGSAADFDILDEQALQDALRHPERHGGLVVRVCGYSVRFVDLDEKMQREIIERTRRA